MHAKFLGRIGLFLGLGVAALGGNPRTRRDIAPMFRIELPPASVAVQPLIQVQLRSLPRVGLWCPCDSGFGGGYLRDVVVVPDLQPFRLKDPVGEIGAAYLQSRSVKAVLLDPEFRVSDYPEGHFGSWVQDGLLVKERVEFTDEANLRHVFALLVESIGEPDDEPFDWWREAPGPKMSAADFRRRSGFVPELSFEFVGAVPLRIELNATQRRMLIQAGDRWGIHALDRWAAVALKDLMVPP